MTEFSASVATLIMARKSGHQADGLPAVPQSVDECIIIQDAVTKGLGAKVGGWKAGLPEGKDPYRAPIYASDIWPSPAAVQQKGRTRFVVEAEIAFRVGRTLPPREQAYERREVIAALESAHAAIELCETRYAVRAPYMARLADNQSQGGFVFGPAVTDWQKLDIAKIPVVMKIDGKEIGRAIGGNPSGDPLIPVVWLANHLRRFGGLEAGVFVTTGSTTGDPPAHPNAIVTVEFEGLGTAEARFV